MNSRVPNRAMHHFFKCMSSSVWKRTSPGALTVPTVLAGAHRGDAGPLCSRVLFVALLGLFNVPAHGQVYVGSAEGSGSIVLSNFPSHDAPELLLPQTEGAEFKEPAKPAIEEVAIKRTSRSKALSGVIESVALKVDVPSQLLHAVIAAESNYNAAAVSPKGAIGLMQLMPATAKRFGINDPFLVQDNVFAGASYLKWLMGFFKGDIELVLAGYNAGEQAVVRAGHKVPNYPETRAYVRRIMADLRSTSSLPL